MESKQNSEEFLRIRKSFAKHLLAEWGLRIIFINVLGLNKKGSTPRPKWSWKLLNPIVTICTSYKRIAHLLPHHIASAFLQLHWSHQKND